MRSLLLALVLSVAAPIAVANAQEVQTDPPASFSNGFGALAGQIGDEMGQPVTAEFSNSDNGDTLQLTTTGLSYWSDSHWPTWTNGWLHVALTPGGSIVRWQGESLDPPPISVPVAAWPSISPTRGLPIGGPLGQRLFCIEGMESTHGLHQYNSTPVWDGEHAQGWLGFLPSTAHRWGAIIGNRASEWAAAARMLLSGAGNQFAGVALGRC